MTGFLLALLLIGVVVFVIKQRAHKQDLVNAYREGQRDRYGIPLRYRRNEAEQAELRNLEKQWRKPPSKTNN